MGNRAYFSLLAALLLAIVVASWLVPFGPKQWIGAVGVLVFYLWCKDVFAGSGWWASRAAVASPGEPLADGDPCVYYDSYEDDEQGSLREYNFSAEDLAELPDLSEAERIGYQELAGRCVAAEDQDEVLAFIREVKDFGYVPHYPTTLNYVRDASDAAGWYFIMALDWKAPVADLQFVLKTALWPQRLAVAWPDPTAYGSRTSVSFEGVWADFDRPLRALGWQLGFIDTEADEYVFVLHLVADAPRVGAAVQRIGYRYFTA